MQRQTCFGPPLSVRRFDRAAIGDAIFTCTRLEAKKNARDSVVLCRLGGRYRAGRVTCFLSHAPPGKLVDPDEEASLALVRWFGVASTAVEQQVMRSLGCPVVRASFVDNPAGNLVPLERLAPCKLAAVPHGSMPDHLVILSRFAPFLQKVPAE